MEYIWFLLIFWMQVSAFRIPCSDPKADKCLGLVAPYFLTNMTLPLPRILSKANLERMCGFPQKTFLDCSENDFMDCDETRRLEFATFRDALVFLCSDDGKAGWDGELQCTVSGPQISISTQCMSALSELSQVLSPLQNEERYNCRILREFVACSTAATEELCGREAWMWLHRYLVHLLSARALNKRCTIDGLSMGVILAILMAIISAGAALTVTAAYFSNTRLMAAKKRANSGPKVFRPRDEIEEVQRGF